MRAKLELASALEKILTELNLEAPAKLVIEEPKQQQFGDLSTNAALLLAKKAGQNPRGLALQIAQRLPSVCPDIEKVEVAGPGFCNVTFKAALWQRIVPSIHAEKGAFGNSESGQGRRVLVEYVSANPTGPLHVGHGRGAALGDSIARLLRAAGYGVTTEYYLNDAGVQMARLGQSIWLRCLELAGKKINYPKDCYQGEYIVDLARELLRDKPELPGLPEPEGIALCREYGITEILSGIRADLARFRCEHEQFASEKELVEKGAVKSALQFLSDAGFSYTNEGALWLKTAVLGDDHDRVLRKSDGSLTYFATDIAYHHDKFDRGFDWLIDIWGADHHGYIPRMQAAIGHMGHDPEKFTVLLVQLVNLQRDGKPVQMSTRSGEFETLAALMDEVGTDAARFMFLSRSHDAPLDFDLELAKKHSLENPVYYVQYAHARVSALVRRAEENGLRLKDNPGPEVLAALASQTELAIMRKLAAFTETVANAAKSMAPYHIGKYLLELAGQMHSYYAHQQILDPENLAATTARMALLTACAQTIKNGLFLLGVSAPDVM